jgi:hypothetical protein
MPERDPMAPTTAPAAAGPPGMPRWLKLLLLGVVVTLVVMVLVGLVMGGEHGPGRHAGGPVATSMGRA